MNFAEERIAFYMEIGQSLTHWAHVENSMRRCLTACFPKGDVSRALNVGFFTLEGARARRDFADAVVARYLARTVFVDEWTKLIDRAQRATGLRNKLAHYLVREFPHGSPGRRFALEPWIYTKGTRKKNKQGHEMPLPAALCLREILKMRLEFIALSNAFDNFLCRVSGIKEPHLKSAEQPSNPPPIHVLRRQTLEALARLLRPSGKKS